jgi:uncharacterized protein
MKPSSLILFFVLAYLFTWAYWLPQALTSRGLASIEPPEFLAIVAGYGPALAAIIVTTFRNGRTGLQRLFSRLVRWRVGFQWYAIALLLPLAIKLVAIGIYLLAGSQPLQISTSLQLAPPDAPVWQNILLLFLLFAFGFDGLGEELGWRGFALPRLQARYSALIASLILGFFWAGWHLPFALTTGSALSDIPLYWYFFFVMGLSILYTWIFNHTSGSVLLAILFHAASNTTANVLATNNFTIFLIEIGLIWSLAVIIIFKTDASRSLSIEYG